ncbi:MAG: Flp family type IVb pilin [Planctomycetaceae bacterium]
MKSFLNFLRDDDGTTAVEYAVMLALILAAVIASVATVGGTTGGMFGSNKAALEAAGFGS